MSDAITYMTEEMQSLLKCSLQEINIDGRIVNQLERQHIYTVEDLLMLTRAQLAAIPNLGDKTIEMIYQRLAVHGFVRYNQTKSSTSPSRRSRKKG